MQDPAVVADGPQDIEVQAIRLVDELKLASAASAGVEQRVRQLAVIADGELDLGAVRAHEVDDVDVLRVRIDDPLEGLGAVAVLGLGEQDPRVGGEGVGAHPVDHFHVVVVEAAAVAERGGRGVTGRGEVARGEGDADAHETHGGGAGVDGAGGDLHSERGAVGGQVGTGEDEYVGGVDEAELEFVAHRVEGAERGALLRGDLPAGVRATRPVEAAAVHHGEGAGIGTAGGNAERVVVVVADADEVGEFVGVGGRAGAFGLGGRATAGVGPDVGRRGPGSPVDVAGFGVVGEGGAVAGRRAEGVGNVFLVFEEDGTEFLPGGGLVLAGGENER